MLALFLKVTECIFLFFFFGIWNKALGLFVEQFFLVLK